MTVPVRLPEYAGYTFDYALREIRRVVPNAPMQFIDFASEEGQILLKAFRESPEGQWQLKRYIQDCRKRHRVNPVVADD